MAKFVKSNAIVFCAGGMTLGVGAGFAIGAALTARTLYDLVASGGVDSTTSKNDSIMN